MLVNCFFLPDREVEVRIDSLKETVQLKEKQKVLFSGDVQ